jgi:hypothetical protein
MYVFPKASNPTWGGPHTVSRNMRPQNFTKAATVLTANTDGPSGHIELKSQTSEAETLGLSAMAKVDNNHALVVELPYSVNRKFLPARYFDYTEFDEDVCPFTSHTIHSYQRYDNQSRNSIKDYVSVAEDFNLSLYLNAPVLFFGQEEPTLVL